MLTNSLVTASIVSIINQEIAKTTIHSINQIVATDLFLLDAKYIPEIINSFSVINVSIDAMPTHNNNNN